MRQTALTEKTNTLRIHTDERAAQSAAAVNARAYTVGRNIVLGTGQYAPNLTAGQKFLAHELVHTTQQNPADALTKSSTFPSRRGAYSGLDSGRVCAPNIDGNGKSRYFS